MGLTPADMRADTQVWSSRVESIHQASPCTLRWPEYQLRDELTPPISPYRQNAIRATLLDHLADLKDDLQTTSSPTNMSKYNNPVEIPNSPDTDMIEMSSNDSDSGESSFGEEAELVQDDMIQRSGASLVVREIPLFIAD